MSATKQISRINTIKHTFSLPASLTSLPRGPAIAVLLSVSLVAWMSLGPASSKTKDNRATEVSEVAVQSVRTIMSVAQETTRLITAEGDTSAMRRSTVSPRISGIVSELLASKGSHVEFAQPIAVLDVPGFSAKEAEARARRDEALRSYDNTETLAKRDLASKDRLVSAKTTLASAEAQWAAIVEQRDDMTLTAPFSGILNTLDVEVGDNLSSGDTVAEVLDLSRLTIQASIPQAQVSSLKLDQSVSVSLVTGETAQGRITYISSQADRQTRSFPIEVEISNLDGGLRAGVSASIEMRGDERMTHAVPAAYLSLGSDGELIVKSVDEGVVVAHAVEVVSSGLDDVLVTGLPDQVEIITVGQGFVKAGDAVRTERAQ